MMQNIIKETQEKMDKALKATYRELLRLRTGKATLTLLDGIKIDYYGNMVPINQVANLSTPESRLIVIQPWEKKFISVIEKAIQASDLGINPLNDGNIIRLQVPQLTEERRKSLVKVAKKIGEDGRVALRNIRRDTNENLKKSQKNGEISEDEYHRGIDKIQEIIEDFSKKLEDALEKKEKDILEV